VSTLEVVAKPVFGKSDAEWLVRARQEHAHSPGAPEFTLVFSGAEVSAEDVLSHVAATCATTPAIKFCLRSAVIVPDLGASRFHVFLVPDEGFGAIIRLHDRLHVGPLAGCLRPETPYIPHLTIASVNDFNAARRIKAKLNGFDLRIDGRIDALEVHERDAGSAKCVANIPLRQHSFFV
jgi:2'-5' RNA ligase